MNYINTQTLTQHTESEIRALYPNTSFPHPFIAPSVYALVFPAPHPAYDQITQRAQAITPELTALGTWEQRWEIVALDSEAIEAKQAAALARAETSEAARITSLWQAAHEYEYAQVSGSAIGLLAMGVLQGLPKCLAVQAWIKSIWTAYYERKFSNSTDTDFSIAGQCPFSVPELMAELGL